MNDREPKRMTTPQTFEDALWEAESKACGLDYDKPHAEASEAAALMFLCERLWESNEDLRRRVAELEARVQSQKDDGK